MALVLHVQICEALSETLLSGSSQSTLFMPTGMGWHLRYFGKTTLLTAIFQKLNKFLPSLDEIDASKRDFERLLASLSDAEKEALLSSQTQVPTNTLLNDSTLLRCDYHTQFSIAGGQLFASTYGHVGLAPELAKLDDVLCFIRGARVPFVLRLGLNKRYRLVGDCYIHVLMHGEVESLELAVEDILLSALLLYSKTSL